MHASIHAPSVRRYNELRHFFSNGGGGEVGSFVVVQMVADSLGCRCLPTQSADKRCACQT